MNPAPAAAQADAHDVADVVEGALDLVRLIVPGDPAVAGEQADDGAEGEIVRADLACHRQQQPAVRQIDHVRLAVARELRAGDGDEARNAGERKREAGLTGGHGRALLYEGDAPDSNPRHLVCDLAGDVVRFRGGG